MVAGSMTSGADTMSDEIERDSLFAEIQAAKESVEHAESAVDALVAKLAKAARAEKVSVSEPLGTALQRLRDARAILERLDTEE
jgi:hypothetical protein